MEGWKREEKGGGRREGRGVGREKKGERRREREEGERRKRSQRKGRVFLEKGQEKENELCEYNANLQYTTYNFLKFPLPSTVHDWGLCFGVGKKVGCVLWLGRCGGAFVAHGRNREG